MTSNSFDRFYQNHLKAKRAVSTNEVDRWLKNLVNIFLPERCETHFASPEAFNQYITNLLSDLCQLLEKNNTASFEQKCASFKDSFDVIQDFLEKDIEAVYAGDPAAKNNLEVAQSYPGIYAILCYRIAHQLHVLGIKNIPRIITEIAHSETGIDIHPGASIGEYFCIDHGTGIVIGETTEIGNHVKLYQGVTLGALSVKKEDAQVKRHPTIGNNVVIYAGATILGGKTIIGNDSIIGGSVWLTKSIEDKSTIYYRVNN